MPLPLVRWFTGRGQKAIAQAASTHIGIVQDSHARGARDLAGQQCSEQHQSVTSTQSSINQESPSLSQVGHQCSEQHQSVTSTQSSILQDPSAQDESDHPTTEQSQTVVIPTDELKDPSARDESDDQSTEQSQSAVIPTDVLEDPPNEQDQTVLVVIQPSTLQDPPDPSQNDDAVILSAEDKIKAAWTEYNRSRAEHRPRLPFRSRWPSPPQDSIPVKPLPSTVQLYVGALLKGGREDLLAQILDLVRHWEHNDLVDKPSEHDSSSKSRTLKQAMAIVKKLDSPKVISVKVNELQALRLVHFLNSADLYDRDASELSFRQRLDNHYLQHPSTHDVYDPRKDSPIPPYFHEKFVWNPKKYWNYTRKRKTPQWPTYPLSPASNLLSPSDKSPTRFRPVEPLKLGTAIHDPDSFQNAYWHLSIAWLTPGLSPPPHWKLPDILARHAGVGTPISSYPDTSQEPEALLLPWLTPNRTDHAVLNPYAVLGIDYFWTYDGSWYQAYDESSTHKNIISLRLAAESRLSYIVQRCSNRSTLPQYTHYAEAQVSIAREAYKSILTTYPYSHGETWWSALNSSDPITRKRYKEALGWYSFAYNTVPHTTRNTILNWQLDHFCPRAPPLLSIAEKSNAFLEDQGRHVLLAVIIICVWNPRDFFRIHTPQSWSFRELSRALASVVALFTFVWYAYATFVFQLDVYRYFVDVFRAEKSL